ncbi:MAG: phenylalanine--tRNA ligase subunit beta [Candidatus Bipolaricaulota bacterium]
MEVSYRWLADFLDLEFSERAVENYSRRLTMAGAEVENITYLGDTSDITVGKVFYLSQHPKADNLHLAKVRIDNDQNIPTITAADNLRQGALVPIIEAPGKLSGTEIEPKTFRGEESRGMLCSKEELGLEEKSSGIWILDDSKFSVGDRLSEKLELDDWILSFEITSNRPDLLSILGVARELAVLTGKTLDVPDPRFDSDKPAEVEIEIENPEDTPRYTARVLTEVEVGPSPLIIQHRLAKIGLRPQNNVVDATNYAMIELGHPLHPFDLDKISGGTIKIRRARSEETLTTLDGKKRNLQNHNLVIADEADPIALAGVMGGQKSEVRSTSKNILLEGACFDQARIRESSQKIGLSTDASKRFEKGMDPEATKLAINRVTEILDQQNSFESGTEFVDEYPSPPEPKKIELRKERADSIIGIDIDQGEIERIMAGLGITVTREGDGSFMATPPSSRVDLTREIDLIEELARIHGYDKIPETPPKSGAVNLFSTKKERVINRAKTVLTGLGLYETISPGFASGTQLDDKSGLVDLKNPMGDKRSQLRSDIGSGLINHAERNFKKGIDSISLFEIGNVFQPGGENPEEARNLGIFLGGRRYEGIDAKQSYTFRDLKGILEDFFDSLVVSNYGFEPGGPEFLHPGRKAEVFISNNPAGYIGELHPDHIERYGLPDRIYLADLDFDMIVARTRFEGNYEELPKYPSSKRDLSLTVPEKITESEIRQTILSQPRVESLYLYDMYQGEQIASGKKSLTYELIFRDREKTLSDDEVEEIVREIRKELEEMGIVFRE